MTERAAPREGRRSALTVAGVFLLIAAWQVYRRHEMPAIVDGTIGGLLCGGAFGQQWGGDDVPLLIERAR